MLHTDLAGMSFCVGMLLVIMLAICTFIELLSMWNLTRREVTLCNMLSPEAPRLSLATYNWGLVRCFSTPSIEIIGMVSEVFGFDLGNKFCRCL